MTAHRDPPAYSDMEQLELAVELFMDERRRLAGLCGVTLAVANDGRRLYVGAEVPDTLVPALVEAVRAAPAAAPEREPPALDACRAILASVYASLALEAGPYYLIDSDVRCETTAEIVRSDGPVHEALRRLNPGNWEPDEWDELLDGVLGPWAIALVEGRAVSICHTPVAMTARAAECGVWTDPAHRGRGYAAAVTAAWAQILRPSGRFLFYSTDAENRSSQRVAARLRLRPIGWIWRLIRVEPEPRARRHPLSRGPSSPA